MIDVCNEERSSELYGHCGGHGVRPFSADETKVAFASDRTGITQVYVVEL